MRLFKMLWKYILVGNMRCLPKVDLNDLERARLISIHAMIYPHVWSFRTIWEEMLLKRMWKVQWINIMLMLLSILAGLIRRRFYLVHMLIIKEIIVRSLLLQQVCQRRQCRWALAMEICLQDFNFLLELFKKNYYFLPPMLMSKKQNIEKHQKYFLKFREKT